MVAPTLYQVMESDKAALTRQAVLQTGSTGSVYVATSRPMARTKQCARRSTTELPRDSNGNVILEATPAPNPAFKAHMTDMIEEIEEIVLKDSKRMAAEGLGMQGREVCRARQKGKRERRQQGACRKRLHARTEKSETCARRSKSSTSRKDSSKTRPPPPPPLTPPLASA